MDTLLSDTEDRAAVLAQADQLVADERPIDAVELLTRALSGGGLPTGRYCEDVSFCGCLGAVIGEVRNREG